MKVEEWFNMAASEILEIEMMSIDNLSICWVAAKQV